jgi:hypothetical protein
VAAAAAIKYNRCKRTTKREENENRECVCVKRDEWSVEYCTNNTGTQFRFRMRERERERERERNIRIH